MRLEEAALTTQGPSTRAVLQTQVVLLTLSTLSLSIFFLFFLCWEARGSRESVGGRLFLRQQRRYLTFTEHL